MRIDNFRLSLRVRHPSADLSDLPDVFGLESVRNWKASEPRTTPKGNKLSGLNHHSYCCMKITVNSDGLSETITAFLTHLRPHSDVVEALNGSGARFMLDVAWFSPSNTGEVFEASLLKALADLHIDLGLDVYGGPDPSDVLPRTDRALSSPE